MATRLTDDVWRLDLGSVNAYLLDRAETVLVDAGTPRSADGIREGLSDAGYGVGDVDRVLVTHFDVDHVGALSALPLDAPVSVPEPDRSYLAREASPPWSQKGTFQRALRPFVRPPDLALERVEDGDEVAGLTAYHTPGHTEGHVVYTDDAVAFLGDAVAGDDGALSTVPWFLNEDTAQARASVRALAERAPAFEAAAMGHGDPLATGGAAALSALAADLA
jgi:glyoxylase-like metal-dependent hydrolase (beta-lactamase superfamily II)